MADEQGITTAAAPPPASPEAAPVPAAPEPTQDPIQEATRIAGPLGGAALGSLAGATQAHQEANAPEPAAPVQPSGKTVRMLNPAGQKGDVPEEKAADAAKAGYKPLVQMTNPKGKVGEVPVDQSHNALAAGYKFGAPIKDSSSVTAAPSITGGDVANALISTPSLNKVTKAVDDAILNIENYTPQGRAEHPILAQVGDMFRAGKNLLLGGAADSANPFALRMSNAGLLNNPLTQAMSMGAGGPEAAAAAEDAITSRVSGAASKAKSAIGDVMEDWFKPTDVPKPQHGTPVSVESPLDRATVNSQPGGKELSDQAFTTLQKHVGDTIPVGSTPKNMLMKGVKPVLRTIEDTGSQLNKVIDNAPEFKTSIMDDANATGPFIAKSAPGASIREGWQGRDFVNSLASEQETGILKDIQNLRENLPLKTEDPLNKVIDTQFQANENALNSTNPKELMAARRKLGNTIDWANITWNPETAGEVANTTKVKLYHAMGNKLKTIDKVAELDDVLQPNLELRSHFDAKLGKAVSRDPVEAEAQQMSEHAKGKAVLESEAHNAKVSRNLTIAKRALAAAGIGAAGAIGVDLAK